MKQSIEIHPPWRSAELRTLLAIDDDPLALSIIDSALRGEFRVLIAQDGERGLELARREPRPDLILLDLMLPGLDGYAVCRLLREHPATQQVPVILLMSARSASRIGSCSNRDRSTTMNSSSSAGIPRSGPRSLADDTRAR